MEFVREILFQSEKRYLNCKKIFQRELFCFRKCDGITVPSKDLKNQLVKLFEIDHEKVTVIPNIIDTNHFKITMKKRHSESFNILHIGRFIKSKGVLTLIKAFIELAKKYKGYFFNICWKN